VIPVAQAACRAHRRLRKMCVAAHRSFERLLAEAERLAVAGRDREAAGMYAKAVIAELRRDNLLARALRILSRWPQVVEAL